MLHTPVILFLILFSFNLFAQCDTWIQKANFGGIARMGAVGFSIGDKGYIGTGETSGVVYTKDFWEYDPAINT